MSRLRRTELARSIPQQRRSDRCVCVDAGCCCHARLILLEKTQRRWRDSRCSVPVADMHPILFVSSPHVQNTSFCVGDASRTSYTYTFVLYSRAVHVQTVTDTQVLQNEHTRALSGRLPPAEPSDARCERARQREAPSGRQQARKARSRLSGTCVPTHARSGIDTCQSHLSKSPVKVHLS